MSVNRDFYAANAIRTSKDMIDLKNRRDLDIFARIKLAASGYADDFLKGAARELYLTLGHDPDREAPPAQTIERELYLKRLHDPYGINLFQKEGFSKTLKELASPLLTDAFEFMNLSVLNDLQVPFFLIEFYFQLKSSLITRDEPAHYPIENPLRKDYALKLPVLNSTSWKGLLRHAFLFQHVFPAWNVYAKNKSDEAKIQYLEKRFQMLRLFGTEKETKHPALKENAADFKKEVIERIYPELNEEDKEEKELPGLTGCLFTYPTFFDQIEIELINPHDSVRRVGTQPIHLEMVPAGSQGLFRLFYLQHVPLMLQNATPDEIARADLKALTEAIKVLFLELGISAKRTSGHGQVQTEFPSKKGRIVYKFDQEVQTSEIQNFNALATSINTERGYHGA